MRGHRGEVFFYMEKEIAKANIRYDYWTYVPIVYEVKVKCGCYTYSRYGIM